MVARITFWFKYNCQIMTATHNVVCDGPKLLLAHVDRLAATYYTCRYIQGKFTVDGRWTGMHPSIEIL